MHQGAEPDVARGGVQLKPLLDDGEQHEVAVGDAVAAVRGA